MELLKEGKPGWGTIKTPGLMMKGPEGWGGGSKKNGEKYFRKKRYKGIKVNLTNLRLCLRVVLQVT